MKTSITFGVIKKREFIASERHKSLAHQKDVNTQFAKDNSYYIVDEVYDYIGKNSICSSEACNILLSKIKSTKVSMVIISSISAVLPNAKDYAEFRELLKSHDVQLISASEGNLSSDGLLGGLLACIEEYIEETR